MADTVRSHANKTAPHASFVAHQTSQTPHGASAFVIMTPSALNKDTNAARCAAPSLPNHLCLTDQPAKRTTTAKAAAAGNILSSPTAFVRAHANNKPIAQTVTSAARSMQPNGFVCLLALRSARVIAPLTPAYLSLYKTPHKPRSLSLAQRTQIAHLPTSLTYRAFAQKMRCKAFVRWVSV